MGIITVSLRVVIDACTPCAHIFTRGLAPAGLPIHALLTPVPKERKSERGWQTEVEERWMDSYVESQSVQGCELKSVI